MSDSVRPYGQQPTRLLCPQDSLGNNTGVDCHFLLHSLAPDVFLHLQRQQHSSLSLTSASDPTSPLTPLSPLTRLDYTGPTQILQYNPPISRSLTLPYLQSHFCHVAYLQVSGFVARYAYLPLKTTNESILIIK